MKRTSQEEGLAPAFPLSIYSGGKPLFLTCSLFRGLVVPESADGIDTCGT